MKEKLTKNLGLKVLSIILAAMLWLVITNVDDPIKAKYFDDVKVQIINEAEITKLGQVYEIIEGQTIDFTVAARRSIADNLTVSDFKVTADFSKLSDVNAVTINIYCPRYGGEVTVTDGMYQVMKVNLEDLEEKHFKVNVVQKGNPADGYYVAEKTANTIIRVSGPKSKIEKIKEIVVDVDVTDVVGSFRTSEEPKALDEEGNEIESSNLKFNDTSVPVNIIMYKTKTVDLQITPEGKPADGYVMTSVEYEPKTIEIAGTDDALSSVSNLTVSENISGASKNIQKEVNIQEQLKDGLILVGDNQTAVVNIGIEKADTKEMFVWPQDLEVRNKPEGMEIEFTNNSPISVTVIGPVEAIKNLTMKNLKPYIDLSNFMGGSSEEPIGIDASGYISLTNHPTVYAHQK